MKQTFKDFKEWTKIANDLGWVHVHDQFIVVDEAESGECVGEWDSEASEGWILKELIKN